MTQQTMTTDEITTPRYTVEIHATAAQLTQVMRIIREAEPTMRHTTMPLTVVGLGYTITMTPGID